MTEVTNLISALPQGMDSISNDMKLIGSKNIPNVLICGTKLKVSDWWPDKVKTPLGTFDSKEVERFWVGSDRDTYICPGEARVGLRWEFITRFPVSGILASKDPVLKMRRKW